MRVPARPIRLVVTDVDGTLVRHDRTLAPSTIAAAQRLRTAGVRLAVVSSRPVGGLDVLRGPLALDTPRAGFNGGGTAMLARSQSYYLDITHTQANKGSASVSLARLLGIAPQDMACIGDMPNDLPMFDVAGFSIAMGNATDEVKARADAVTEDNDSDGWALAVERFVLGA